MQTHDDDNIPVLEDIIYEHDILRKDTPSTNEKQKALWDDNADEFAEQPEAVAAQDEYANEYPWSGPVVAFDDEALSGEMLDDTNVLPGEEPVALFHDDESGDAIEAVEAVSDDVDNFEVFEADPQATIHDESISAVPLPVDDAPSSRGEQIDIDALAQRVLYRIMPDLEDYLHDRIRDALKSALDDKTRD
jgi:hypothetical protein